MYLLTWDAFNRGKAWSRHGFIADEVTQLQALCVQVLGHIQEQQNCTKHTSLFQNPLQLVEFAINSLRGAKAVELPENQP